MGFTAPRTGGDQLPPADIVGHLLVVKPYEFRPQVQTKDYGLVDAIECDVVDLDTPGGPAQFRGVLWFNKMLVSGLRRQIGEIVLGWMTTGVARGRQDPPFQLADATTDPTALSRGQTWLSANPTFESGLSAPATTQPAASPLPKPNGTGSMPANLQPSAAIVATTTGNAALDALDPEQRAALQALGFKFE